MNLARTRKAHEVSFSNWWSLSPEAVALRSETNLKKGLSREQAQAHLQKYGPNLLPESKGISPVKIFFNQFTSLIVWVLVGAAAIAGVLGEWIDTIAVLVIIVMNAILGFVQEYQAERSLAALRKLSTPVSKVIRDGIVSEIPSRDIVPGDLVLLEAGDRIPADGRLVHAIQLRTHEAALTGESVPVGKISEALHAAEIPLGDRKNIVFMGTVVVHGKGEAVITATGLSTELGKIAALLERGSEEKTPLQERLEKLGKRLVMIFLGVVAVVFFIGVIRGNPWMEMILTSLSLAVAAIPEGLPAVVTISLAIGVNKMAKRKALVRRLPSVETLGCATVICSDKTGTLTKNEMTIRWLWVNGKKIHVTGAGYIPEGEFQENDKPVNAQSVPGLTEMLQIGVLCNNATLREVEKHWTIVGDPTEAAFLTLAAKAGIWKEMLEEDNPIMEEIPFDSERKRMSVLRKTDKHPRLFVKGAPDVMMKYTSQLLLNGEVVPFTEDKRHLIEKANHDFASKALRVLALAYRPFPDEIAEGGSDFLERDLVLVGLVAMMDPPRPEAKKAIEICKKAGIIPVMITGDHKETAVAIAKELELMTGNQVALSGSELDSLSDQELEGMVDRITVYARVSAEHKLKIVRAWKKKGAVTAMTGDGVNDAPAIKEADIGVAMGIAGTDVTKEASDMVIMDDNFASIVSAVEEGRGIYDNILKFVQFLLTFNLAEILVLFAGILIGFIAPDGKAVIPLSALQILWMNLVTDGLPAIALGVDPLDPYAMARPPRPARASLFTKSFAADLLLMSTMVAAGTIFACGWGARISAPMAQTMTLTTLVMLQMVGIQAVRSAYHVGFFSNRWLVAALVSSIGLQIVIIYAEPCRLVFDIVPLGFKEWGVIFGIIAVVWPLTYFLRLMIQKKISRISA